MRPRQEAWAHVQTLDIENSAEAQACVQTPDTENLAEVQTLRMEYQDTKNSPEA